MYCTVLYYTVLFNSTLFCSVLLCSFASSNSACWIMLVMPTRSLLPGTPCFLGSCAIHIHFNASMASHSIATMARVGLRPPHTPPGSIYISIASILAPESQIMLFFSKL